MSKIKLVVEVDEEMYQFFKETNLPEQSIYKIIAKGTPITEGDLISRSGVVAFLENLKFEPNAHWLAEVLQDKKRFPSIGGSQNE